MGSLKNKINELEERIKNNRKAIAELDEMFYKFSGPKGYPTGTSWQDYDCIRGSKKEWDVFKFAEEKQKLQMFIEIDKEILEQLKKNQAIITEIQNQPKNYDKVKYLKRLGYRNVEIAELLDLTEQHICRIVRRIREENNNL